MCSKQQISPNAKGYCAHQPPLPGPGSVIHYKSSTAPILFEDESRGRRSIATFSDSPLVLHCVKWPFPLDEMGNEGVNKPNMITFLNRSGYPSVMPEIFFVLICVSRNSFLWTKWVMKGLISRTCLVCNMPEIFMVQIYICLSISNMPEILFVQIIFNLIWAEIQAWIVCAETSDLFSWKIR